jgi:hypothetical protein
MCSTRVRTEDSLLELIIELGGEYRDLIGFVRCEWLSVSGIERLVASISIEDLDERLWASLCCRLRLSVFPSSIPGHRYPICQFDLDSSGPLDGALSHLTRECGGNVHDQGIVQITASSNRGRYCHQVVDYTWNSYWYSYDIPNSWIQFDFKSRRISPANYTIKSDGSAGNHLVQWSLDGSNDGVSWTTLDRRNTQDLNGQYIVKSYRCNSLSSPSSFFRFIRLIQTGPNPNGAHNLQLGNFEVFGALLEPVNC